MTDYIPEKKSLRFVVDMTSSIKYRVSLNDTNFWGKRITLFEKPYYSGIDNFDKIFEKI